MTWPVRFDPERLSLSTDRISPGDARRQEVTVREILKRLERQPGLILADEVGMGKTFVALAVAVSVAWGQPKGKHKPVVVMVPPSLEDKWPRDFQVFREKCLRNEEDKTEERLRIGTARRGVEFLKLLDDSSKKRCHLIFLTHGALSSSLRDPWTKLAILKLALSPSRFKAQREAFPRFAAELLRIKTRYNHPELFRRLFKSKPDRWRAIIAEESDDDLGDDPVPEAIDKVLRRNKVDLRELRASLWDLPLRDSPYLSERLTRVRQELAHSLQKVWRQALVEARISSPLLILDEAHHLKNPATRLASLFVEDEAREDADFLGGELKDAFERMLFLTATPFQLGHHELLNVLSRFQGTRWDRRSIQMSPEEFTAQQDRLKQALNETYTATSHLDSQWKRLSEEDLHFNGQSLEPEAWWQKVVTESSNRSEKVQVVLNVYHLAQEKMADAERLLRPWIIRHRRSRHLPNSQVVRRRVLTGAGIETDVQSTSQGIAIQDQALLPFLLAARTQTVLARIVRQTHSTIVKRATFAEGLASSYEAFLETRSETEGRTILDETSEEDGALFDPHEDLQWYLDKLRKALPARSVYAEHPKIQKVIRKVVELWRQGEKVVVFCHFRATGRALEDHSSRALESHFHKQAAEKIGCSPEEAGHRLTNIGEGFNPGRSIYHEFQRLLEELFAEYGELGSPEKERITAVLQRFVRTPSFLARYYPFEIENQGEAFREAIESTDASGLSLRDKLRGFIHFIVRRCQASEREEYLSALEEIQPGKNVRLANGAVKPEYRRRLLLAFNTPFFPEVLIASSVLAEGVDLHLNCRYVIHHDLCWNPSTLEQRTGRVDRINAKAEQVHKPIHIYLPYLGATQDEKMYRVVRDRERWFQVLMGENYRMDEVSTDIIERRVPLPEQAARGLAFNLEVYNLDTAEPS